MYTCDICGLHGHLHKECPVNKRKTCIVCKTKGHLPADCLVLASWVALKGGHNLMPIPRIAEDPLWCKACIKWGHTTNKCPDDFAATAWKRFCQFNKDRQRIFSNEAPWIVLFKDINGSCDGVVERGNYIKKGAVYKSPPYNWQYTPGWLKVQQHLQ
ncbi:hypothetical protein GPALN_014677 [Globodera pallida]|uniref:CCHC-type domain-containing protein n=1 Tax=Globodera pallida TaxID=36090 RepID=A0A183CMF5_GLOPA|nr:hypothetical protein GPALN_014677 [Globodera pallida]